MGILNWVIGGSTRRTRRFSLAGRWLPAGAVVTGLVLLGGVVPANAQTLTWSVVHSPNRELARAAVGNSFDAVSCASTSACTAVGSYLNGLGAQRTLAESWDGTRWSLLRSPNRGRTGTGNALFGVSCAAPRACMAVGASGLASGGASALPSWGASRLSIDSLQTLAELWNGTRWSVLPSPNRGTTGDNFDSVSCVSADACVAVGAFGSGSTGGGTLAESWDGARWSLLPSPNPIGAGDAFRGVSCASADACMAVGLAGPSDNGPFSTLAEFWNGSRWSVVPSPNGPGFTWLWGVSCAATDACNAAGLYFAKAGPPRTLIESWDGTRWSMVPAPSPGVQHMAQLMSALRPRRVG